ncbi:single-stranded-DNA-specific exonuclease RecJ [Treponema primitia]|uniref:single-stranded-DNA-specific exonuclease RecJ n=1 Tax=Treponema primitia TaxID=88058 RepID=UPI0002554F14|nr:single-stranded-DNA-specific exonuclease RecJ [Treponema primitia]
MIWDKKDIPSELVTETAAKYSCDLLTASILVRRGLTSGEDIRYFLEDDPRHLRNPFELPGIDAAVERILGAKEEGERILVFGDRDVDGITSTAMLTGFLSAQGMDVRWRLPMGDEPYGLSMKAVEEFAADSGTLIITVDCGISNLAEVDRAAELGVDVIITDHHNPQDELPRAYSIVNPKLKNSTYPFRDLAGCGVAYKLVSALRFALKSELYNQPICLLNTQPSNDSYIIEIVKIGNLAVMDRLTETVVPGMVGIGETRIPAFLEGQQILVWDAPLQKKTLVKIFGAGFEIYMLDIAPEIGKQIPQAAGKSLLRLKEISRIAKYADKSPGELDIFINLFTSFIQKKEGHFTPEDSTDLQLAALGTVADLMPLRDENRIIVRRGLASLIEKPRSGLSDLLFKLGLAGRRFGTTELSWQLCPAINAAGRMGCPDKAAALLLAVDPKERETLAAEIIALNEDRKKLGSDNWTVVEPLAQESVEAYGGKFVLAAAEGIYRGVTGIMANRLVNRFKVPALVVSFAEETATGSLRSARGYELRPLLEGCADLFLDWGGHNFAAGFSMVRANWEPFLERLKYITENIELGEETDEETVTVDAEFTAPRTPQFLTTDLFELVDRFEPYGEENSPLSFLARGLKVTDISLMGKPEAKHVKLTLDTGKVKWPAVYWQAVDKIKRDFDKNDTVDLVFTLNRNWFNGTETPQLIVTDLKRS